MGNTRARKRTRRAVGFLATLGLLVMSSGVALMVTATPADAATKVTFCHSTGSEQNPWIELTTSVNAFYVGHVLKQHTSDIYPAVSFEKKGQTINVPAQGDQAVLANHCGSPEEPGPLEIAVDVEFTDPSCDNNNTASYEVTGDTDDVTVDSTAPAAPGATITVTATANEGNVFEGGAPTYSEEYTFGAAEDCSTVTPPVVEPPAVSPPVVNPPKHHTKTPSTVVTPTVVHAGLAGVSAEDMRGEQGLALMVAGMVMLVAAGGLGLRLRGSAARI